MCPVKSFVRYKRMLNRACMHFKGMDKLSCFFFLKKKKPFKVNNMHISFLQIMNRADIVKEIINCPVKGS